MGHRQRLKRSRGAPLGAPFGLSAAETADVIERLEAILEQLRESQADPIRGGSGGSPDTAPR